MKAATTSALKKTRREARRRARLLCDYQGLFPDIVMAAGESEADYFARLEAAYRRKQSADRLGVTPERIDKGDKARRTKEGWRIYDVSEPCKRLMSTLTGIPEADRRAMIVAADRFTHDWRLAYHGGKSCELKERVDNDGGDGSAVSEAQMAARDRVRAAMDAMGADAGAAVRDMLIHEVTQSQMEGLAKMYKNDKQQRVAAAIITIMGLRALVRHYRD